MDLKEKARTVKIIIPALFLAIKRKDTPVAAKIFAVITVFYALSPIDLIPDFIPVLGYLDDLIVLPLLAALAVKFIPEEILGECKTESENMWKNGMPKKWFYAIPIAAIWLTIIIWMVT